MKSATIEKIHTVDGSYGLSDNRWDSLPEWTYWDACLVRIKAIGEIQWGPLTYRVNSKKEHQGIAQVELVESKIFGRDDYEKRADEYLLEIGIKLEAKGYAVLLEEYENTSRQNFQKKIDYIGDKPPNWVIGRIKNPTLDDLI